MPPIIEAGNVVWHGQSGITYKGKAELAPSPRVPHLRAAQVALLAATKCFEEHDEMTAMSYIATLQVHVAQAMGVARVP